MYTTIAGTTDADDPAQLRRGDGIDGQNRRAEDQRADHQQHARDGDVAHPCR